jgi:hypothetical protein
MDAKKKPKGFKAFDNLMRKLVRVPAAAQKPTDMCVCGHPRSAHFANKCTVPLCACGPGCIHEGFVRADGLDEPKPKKSK